MLVKEITPTYIDHTPVMIELLNIRHIRPHRHSDAIELLYCLEGNLRITIAHEDISLATGEIVTVDHDDIHYVTADEDNTVLIIHIDMKNVGHKWQDIRYIFFSCATKLCKPHQQDALHSVYDIMLIMAYTYFSRAKNSEETLRCMSMRLVDILLEKFSWFAVEGFTAEENKKYRSRLNYISAYLQQHYQEKITISQLAEKVHIDENYLSQFMKRISFLSFTFTVNYIRSYEAEKLLLFTDKSIQEISDLCGFSSVKYFHKYFKAAWETTPLQHKIKYRKIAAIPQSISTYESGDALDIIKENIVKRYVNENIHVNQPT